MSDLVVNVFSTTQDLDEHCRKLFQPSIVYGGVRRDVGVYTKPGGEGDGRERIRRPVAAGARHGILGIAAPATPSEDHGTRAYRRAEADPRVLRNSRAGDKIGPRFPPNADRPRQLAGRSNDASTREASAAATIPELEVDPRIRAIRRRSRRAGPR